MLNEHCSYLFAFPCPFAQELLSDPNPSSPAQSDAFIMFTQRLAEYNKVVKKQALDYPPPC